MAYWLPERRLYVDAEGGREIAAPEDGSSRSVTEVERDGQRVAAIIHDPALDDSRDLVAAPAPRLALALENERLDAELRARVEELRASRARLVRAGLDERRRLERDLHDGAQQRLVALRLALGLRAQGVATRPPRSGLLDGAMTELDAALEELRELARGIHPGVLTDHGLEPALDAARRPRAAARASSTCDRGAAAGGDRVRRLLHGRRGADERREVRRARRPRA